MGRFLQLDPIGFWGDRTNLYRYCRNNPVTHWDPSGLEIQNTKHDPDPDPYGGGYYDGDTGEQYPNDWGDEWESHDENYDPNSYNPDGVTADRVTLGYPGEAGNGIQAADTTGSLGGVAGSGDSPSGIGGPTDGFGGPGGIIASPSGPNGRRPRWVWRFWTKSWWWAARARRSCL